MKAGAILRKQTNWENLYFYRKADVLHLLTKHFTARYLKTGDRTVDQMVQAARSGKQNIVEGMSDGVSSTQMEMKLLNVARASLQELQEDYKDYLASRHLTCWTKEHERYGQLLDFCRKHNRKEDYMPLLDKATDEELANLAVTLCRQVDKMMFSWLEKLENDFKENGGLSERMTAVRQGYRQTQKETIEAQAQEIQTLKAKVAQLEAELEKYKGKS